MELIVSIAILGIVGSMGISAFGNVMESARRQSIAADGLALANALNNHNAMATGYHVWITRRDYGDEDPYGMDDNNVPGFGASFGTLAVMDEFPEPWAEHVISVTQESGNRRIHITHNQDSGFIQTTTTIIMPEENFSQLFLINSWGAVGELDPGDLPFLMFDGDSRLWRVIL